MKKDATKFFFLFFEQGGVATCTFFSNRIRGVGGGSGIIRDIRANVKVKKITLFSRGLKVCLFCIFSRGILKGGSKTHH